MTAIIPEIPDQHVPVSLEKGEHVGEVVKFTVEIPVTGIFRVIGVNIKTYTPCDEFDHIATISVTSSRVSSEELLRPDVTLPSLEAFSLQNKNDTCTAIIPYLD